MNDTSGKEGRQQLAAERRPGPASENNSVNEVMTMKLIHFGFTLFAGFVFAFLSSAAAFAQQIPVQANPTPGCTSTPAQLAAAKKTALDFAFLTGEAKVAMADPTYIQHNTSARKTKISVTLSHSK